ncbi:hypothetical protein CALCODRAFT_437337 [Calocera cornea HHB12733]|uniref:Uncharacterized protein n=1 Tax=Calocera cornea HHB12733 TaxID=1353952 RepID=A0A165EQM6_9BASI|nr:hypothetical protein CALCODRAFT_437337 [Calocera cornea HHB12733]
MSTRPVDPTDSPNIPPEVFEDHLLPSPLSLDPVSTDNIPIPEHVPSPPRAPAESIEPVLYRTTTTRQGLFREYIEEPLNVPDAYVGDWSSTAEVPTLINEDLDAATDDSSDFFWPYPNWSSFAIDKHYWQDSKGNKSQQDLLALVATLNDPRFCAADLLDVNWVEVRKLLTAADPDVLGIKHGPGYATTELSLQIPMGKQGFRSFVVPGFRYRPLLAVAMDVCQHDANSSAFHYTPYRLYQQLQPSKAPERIFDDVYSSDAWIGLHEALQHSEVPDDCQLPRAVLGLAFWSDATQAAQFGHSKLWPLYMMVLNQPKGQRLRPRDHSCHRLALLPEVPAELPSLVRQWGGKASKSSLMTFCRRQLFHAAWSHLIDEQFRSAYEHGVVVPCGDGIRRRLFPRILFYSADYPEKTLIATIKDLGGCPCPRCLVTLDNVRLLGTSRDLRTRAVRVREDTHTRQKRVIEAFNNIVVHGWPVESGRHHSMFKENSWVPIVNAFSPLASLGFNIFSALVVDVMHETELGVWKAVLVHLLRILHAHDPSTVLEFNTRFREVPKFGRETIRKFVGNVSDLKQMAARDYEDILQCIIPVFEGLLPEPHNSDILALLFTLGQWHALSKLQIHSERTVTLLQTTTVLLGHRLRLFTTKTCSAFQTFELEREAAARSRAAAKNSSGLMAGESTSTRRPKTFNLRTYKLHSLGDVAPTIPLLGPTDGYSTQVGELAHRKIKDFYRRGSKRDHIQQVTKLDSIGDRLRRMDTLSSSGSADAVLSPEELLPYTDGKARYHMAKRPLGWERLGEWELKHLGDRAAQDFTRRLRNHLYARLFGIELYEDIPMEHQEELQRLYIVGHRIYWHAALRLNYTTYNLARGQDYINPNTDHCNIMMLSSAEDDQHPYWYARVLRIFHVVVSHPKHDHGTPQRMDALFVRWLGSDPDASYDAGWEASRMDRVGFVHEDDEEAFGFVDPSWAIREVHLCPAFVEGRTADLLTSASLARDSGSAIFRHSHEDWRLYYVMRCV